MKTLKIRVIELSDEEKATNHYAFINDKGEFVRGVTFENFRYKDPLTEWDGPDPNDWVEMMKERED